MNHATILEPHFDKKEYGKPPVSDRTITIMNHATILELHFDREKYGKPLVSDQSNETNVDVKPPVT